MPGVGTRTPAVSSGARNTPEDVVMNGCASTKTCCGAAMIVRGRESNGIGEDALSKPLGSERAFWRGSSKTGLRMGRDVALISPPIVRGAEVIESTGCAVLDML